ncbi:glycosyltransferase [Microbacterium terregens]|uniref:Glycosyltransferase n=1 Tax=Microbacterium terregens TaxID=69363 RepID=A0ABV5T3C7_9MICO
MIDHRITALAAPARSSYADVVVRGAERASGDVLVAVEPRADLSPADVQALVDLSRSGAAVIPVSLSLDGTVSGMGSAHVGGDLPYRILAAHPQEDIVGLGDDPIPVPMITGRTFAIPLTSFVEAGGLDRALVNDGELEILSIRLREQVPHLALLVAPQMILVLDEPERAFSRRRARRLSRMYLARRPDASTGRATQMIDAAGFDVEGWDLKPKAEPVPQLRWRSESAHGLRWAIKICAPAGPRGAVWGDTHFARGLANALRRAGQTVVIDAYDARARSTTYLDDVSIVVRGPYRIDPPATGIALEWIISHPDQVSKEELRQFHRVFAASTKWPEKVAREWDIPVIPLLEATDVDLFHPRRLGRTEDIVFVGTARGIARPSVVEPIRAGIPVKVYGPDWRPFIPAASIAATSIPNVDLSRRYETASIVLNDQWPAMRREGFIAMRPFDVVASGGRVISEDVDGIKSIFGDAVAVYGDEHELVELLRTDPSELFPDDQELELIGARIRAEHSFDSRARTLVAAVEELRCWSRAAHEGSGEAQVRTG